MSYNGILEIEIGGLNPGSDFDQLNHILGNGIADLGGTLNVNLINGFAPSEGDVYEIIAATNVQGEFDVENLPTLAGGLQWAVDYQPSSVSLLVSLGGDFDLEGNVDGSDFLTWQRTDGTLDGLAEWQTSASKPASEHDFIP